MASSKFPVAVIGIGVRLPGAKNCQQFWGLMINGEDTVGEFSKERAADVDHVLAAFRGQLVDEEKPFFTGSFFESVDKFDPDVFQINPREAHFIEPEQRFFLEVVWEMLEDAAYASKIRGSNTGVYVGNTVNKYKYILNENHPSISHGNHSPFISSRVSYTHDLHGPAMMVATGCSSSLLAVHLACQGLLSGDCEMAIAGGITLDLLPISAKTDIWNQLGITGPNVKCRAFDASAKGIAKGEGCGVILLKPLHKAIEDGDHIYGTLEATTANQDGHSNGITAPHPIAQANMLHQAWKLADIKPDSLGFFEAHGTGTELGDPIEISGITSAFKMSGIKNALDDEKKIPIGSVKANIGHLADGAAGIVGLIKALLCINRNKIPGAINFDKPNPHINWKKSPVYVNTSSLDWLPGKDSPRIASISAFGLLGTNIHAVLKEHQPVNMNQKLPQLDGPKPEILCFAANTSKSLKVFTGKLLEYFKNCSDKSVQHLRNVCFTINTGREQHRFPYKVTVLAKSWVVMTESLEQLYLALVEKSFHNSALHAINLAVIFNGVDQHNSLTFSGCHSTSETRTVRDFLKCKKVQWADVYQDPEIVQIVPQLPTYAFDHVRLWPKIDIPINSELLQLEHKFKGRNNYHGFLEEHQAETTTNTMTITTGTPTNIRSLLHKSLNSALNTQYNWEEIKDENLFALGMDSLIFTQVSMMLKDKLNINLSMAEFHKNPTYEGLINLTKTHNKSNVSNSVPDNKKTQLVATAALERALNKALGKSIDWKTYAEENLFTLGVDSLIYTHVNMKLRESTNLDVPITMAELHKNPTFESICTILQSKLQCNGQSFQGNSQEENHSLPEEITSDTYPISFAQRRLWVMQQLVTNPCAYNATNCLKFTGDFHPVAFTKAVNHVLSNNAAFYTVIEDSPSGPVQKHKWNLNIQIQNESLTTSGSEAEKKVMDMYNKDYKTPFVLSDGPLVRCKLYHLPNNTYYYTMVIHHIIFDGWSHFVFYNELWTTYKQITEGCSLIPTLKRPFYTEIALEEQELAKTSSSRQAIDLTYWTKKLTGALPLTTFPGDKKRPSVFTYNGGRITRFIKHDLIQKLNKFSQDHHTMFMTLLSTVYALLKRYTGEHDFIIGTPIAGRYDMRSKEIIGCFINTLALRVQLPENPSFQEILQDVSSVCLEAYDHQQAAFDHLVSQLNLPRDTSITPVFSVNVCYHNTEIKSEHVNPPEELTVERKLLHNDSSKWDVQFDFLHEAEGMRFTLEYYADLFSDKYATCIVDNFLALLIAVAENPRMPVEKLNLQSELNNTEEHFKVSFMQGNQTNLGEKSLPKLLLASIAENSSSYVTDENGQSSYTELMKNICCLSQFLTNTCNLKKCDRVGILMENSTKSLESVITCVLSGLVYVPLDVNSPKSRLEKICTEANLKAIIFSSPYINIANHLHWICSTVETVLCLDAEVFGDIIESNETPLMDTELWDCVATQAVDKIEGGGWMSSYTGEHMSDKEMKEYSNNVFKKLEPYLTTSTRVLEIGCASGLTTQMIKPNVESYIATDLSKEMVNNLKKVYADAENMEVFCAAADQVRALCKGKTFDMIIINSVIHCFPGYNYLRKVLSDCEAMLSEDGVIFLGDVMDLDLRDNLVNSMKSFKAVHPEYRVKTNWNNELFVSRMFLDSFCSSSSILNSAKHSKKLYTVRNELTEFRFDSILFRARGNKEIKNGGTKKSYARKDIEQYSCTFSHQLKQLSDEISFDDEAYILYTSGTTGTPKGVVISHEALLNYSTWARRTYQFSPKIHTPYFAPLTFDFTVTSIFPPLLTGSNIHIFKNFQDSYQEIAKRDELNVAKFSPMQLDMLLSSTKDVLSIKTYILGGEELTSTLMNKLKANQGDKYFEVWNEYGPTEATVGCVVRCFRSHELPLQMSELVTIGYPIDNVDVGIIRNNKLVPIGAKGFLAIGGKCLCLGFVGNSEEKRIRELKSLSSCLWGSPVDRMLITEDVVEILPSSKEMAYFGRKDGGTTKVNGIRVDITEIQNAIENVFFVKGAWVCSFEFEKRTYIGAAIEFKKQTKDMESWKRVLFEEVKEHLPLRSIPKVLIAVTKPPTNINGKKDTAYLRTQFVLEMQSSNQHSDNELTMVSNSPILAKLQNIWHSILPINYLPKPNQNFFFDLSGDSLQAIHLVRKMRDEGFKVSVTDIFQNPTIEKLLSNLKMSDDDVYREEEEEEEENIAFKPTPIVEDFLLQDKRFPDYFALSALLDFHTKVDVKLLRKALRSVMKKHGSLRSKLYKEDGQVQQKVVPLKDDQPQVIKVDFESMADHLSDEKEFIETCQNLDRSHSLEDGILVGGAVFNIKYASGNTKCYGLLVVHHVALDIVSWQQILEDLATAFRMLSNDEEIEPVLKPCRLTYRSYCEAVHAEANGIFAPEVNYWADVEKQSRGAGVLVEKDIQSKFKTAKWYSKSIDASSLRATSTGMGCSDEQVLLTAFGRSMATIHGKDKTALCMESHGRQLDVDSSDTVGWCTSMFPFILDTPLKEDIIGQVKQVGKDLNAIPNHGLGFGLLKSAGKISMTHPKVTFIFQGSLDASSKETLDGGKYQFDHIPWIEIMLNELRQRRFHRHFEELLEFDLEFIAWIHGGGLKFGCLFDEETVTQATVEDIVKRAEINLNTLAKRVNTKKINISLNIIPGFVITPECADTIKDALQHHDINIQNVKVNSPDEFLQTLCQSPAQDPGLVVVIPRLKNDEDKADMLNVWSRFQNKHKKKLVVIETEDLPKSYKLPTLPEDVPIFKFKIHKSHYDSDSDLEYNMPLSKEGYTCLGLDIARYLRGSQKKTQFKVVAVDGDYTLWEGECAQGEVKLSEGNIALQNYLLNLKQSGMLLVLLSKNEKGDVMEVFRNRPENMVLNEDDFVCIKANWEKKHLNITETATFLNLGLDSFVFIDDNIFECEEMLRNCPSILTLMYPGDAKLIPPFLDSLWMLDNFNITEESAARTELYRNEISRQEDLRSVRQESSSLSDSNAEGLTRILRDWKMKMVILKTTIKELKLHQPIFSRVSELLHRTNQFKLNDVHTDILQFSENQKIWIVSLKDARGTYGIISVCILEEENGKSLQLIQWLISCRALNRQVENRIFYELYLSHTSAFSDLEIQINTTKRNTPMIKFLHDLDPALDVNADLRKQHIRVTPKINLNLHSVHSTIYFEDLEVDFPKKRPNEPSLTKPEGEDKLDSFHLIKHINTAWTPLLQDQASKHHMFPIIPHCQYLEINTSTDTSLVDTLINTWMDVLNTTVVPDNDSNFLEQGGTSFAAVFLVSKLRRLHSVNISIIDLLKNPNFGVFMNIVLSADKIAQTKCEPRTNSRKEGNISNAQQRMIVMQESAPLSTSYVETAVVVTSTDRPVDARETFQALLQVHPILTSKIKAAQNQQSFFMTPDHEMKVDVTEEQVSCDDIVKYISDTIPLIQVLSSPLAIFRKIIYRNQTFMVVHVHHIICDEVTLSSIKETVVNILQRSFLDQVKDGDAYQLYLQSEHDYRKSNQFAEDGYFWQKLYLTIPPTSTLSNLPEGQSLFNDSRVYQAKHHFADLPNEVLGLIKELKLTEFQYYLACSVIVIQRYLGTEEIALAVPVTTRSFQFKKSDGLFVNTIIPKFTSDGNVCLVENIKHIAETWLQAMDHSHYPLDELSRYLWQQHNQSFSSFCNVMFNYVCAASDSSLNIPAKHAKMPLTINFVQGQSTNKTQVWMEWATELVPDNTAKRLSASIVELIAQSRNELETPLYKAPTLSKSETRLIQSFSESRIPQDYDEVPCHITFEKHVQLYGNEIAIICDGRSLTYQELNSKGNKIAAGILNIVHPQELKKKPVVLLMKKGEEAIASILGIWKAGGHFLPVSISNRSTIKNIYQRADPALVITTEDIGSLVKDFGKSTCPVLSVDDVSGESDHKYIIEQSIEDIAYVIRTSGSTGTPKQCKVSHRSLQIMSTAWKEIYKMDKFKVNILQWAPLSFDVFVGDLTRALVSVPGTMVICSDERRLDIPCILNLIKVNNISLVEVTPQFGQQIVENADIGDLDSLQILILGSDAVKSHLFTRVKNQLKPNQRLINSYGMTEATIDSACFEGDPPVTRSGTVPIGKPLPGVKLHILNPKTLQPCPIGTVGELYIGGEILASGDVEVVSVDGLNTNNLKTGDSACWLPSGDIELLGRLDNVMKLRGFRISSTEIENKIISKNPEIKSVCVTPVTSENDVEFLCAFVVLNGVNDGDISKKTLGDRMKGDLPYYMIPDVVHIIKKIPLTTNGKVNIKALPTLPNLFRASEKHTQAYESKPSSLSTLKGLFTEAMCLANIDDVDTEQTFMEQGGHSLTLLRFSTLIKQRTDYTISIADIFSYPSLSTLSRFIDENQKTEDISESPKTTDTAGEHIDIAITGVGMRLPGDISSISELWKVLTHGEDLIREFPASRKDDALKCMNSTTSEALSACDTFQGSFLDSIDHFDSQFFKIPPGEAKYMSPEQRLFLQVATEALSEGRNIDKIKGSKVGVFVSNSEISYAELDLPDEAISISGLMPGMIATRVAYQFDLKGPTLLVDTACSSSLMALKLACESIQKGECDGALVGGANLVLYPARTGVFGETGILSPDFHCKAFDRDATGTAVGEGVMCIYVEPLKAATQKGKPIYGVLKGVASNSVGHGNGITAPTSASQKQVIESALKLSQMAPSDISFIEAHGTGTKLGDKIELSALSSVFSPKAGVRDIPIGAAKSIFGHLDSAAGMIGILKVLASMMFKKIPPTAHFKNPHSELVDSLLAVPAKTTVWPSNVNRSRAAGISSFGLTGTNCHAIISQSQPLGQINDNNITSPLLLTGNDHNQIQNQIRRHITFIEETVVNAGINTISSLCVAVANRIRDLGQAKLGYMTLKLAIYLKSHTQALKVLELLNSCNDMDDMANLADVRSDIGVNFLKQRREANQGVEDFLTSGTVNLDLLFGDDKPVPARGVYLEMFNPKRHWCDPSSSSPTEKVGLLNILETKLSDAREMVRSLPLAASEELRELEGKFCVAIVIKLLMTTKLNQYLKQSSEVSLKTIFKETGMLPKYDKLFYVMIRELYDNHVVIPTGNDKSIHCLDTFRFYCEHLLDANPEPIAQYAMEKYPAWSDCFRFPLYCSQYLTKVLWGNMSPLSVIYPQGDLNYMYQFDKLGDLIGDVYYNMYMQLIAAYAKQLSGRGRKVRILEVGAGMGHVTRQLIPKLKDMPNIEYWFTDLGKAFVENAKTLFEDYLHMMKFSTFDITKSAPKQGLLGCYDIVISYNVIHTTESVMDSVINLKSCLGEDGTLFIIESAKNETWATLAWGILDGWWYFKDYDLRPDEPMMEPEQWERVLKGSGFGSVHSCPVDQFERDQVEKFLFVCSAKPLVGELQQLPGWWETIDLKTRRHQDLEDEVCKSTDTGVEDAPVERTAVHGELKQIWCELFGIDNIKPGDEFNSLGGESLLAIQMMTMVRKRIGYQLEIADTFGYPSLGGLADFIADKLEDGVEIEMGDTEQWSNISTPSSLSEIDENECVSTMLMFPGQGSQKPGMCVSMKDSPEARAVFNEAAKILGYNILEMFLQNDKNLAEKLKSTEFVQVALLVGCLAKTEQIKAENPEKLNNITYVSGLSVGEFAALVYSKVISFEEALKIVQVRGHAMENEVHRSATGMVSVFGPSTDKLQKFLNEKFSHVKISTYLADNQHTVAGTESETEELVRVLSGELKDDMDIIDVRKLRVAGAFHSTYMKPASEIVDPIIESVEFSKPTVPLIMNVTGEVVNDPVEIKSFVCEQLVAPVLWKQSVITAYEAGVTNFVEVAPARVISSIVKNRIASVKNCTVDLIVV